MEEQALNNIKLEAERISRLIEQRRRENNVSMSVSTADVVEQAEFNITSSTYLGIARKEQIKPTFDIFYSDLASRSFQAFPSTTPNVQLLNELAKQIQDGKTAPALANLRRVQELNAEALSQLTRKARPSFPKAIFEFKSRPLNILISLAVYIVLLMSAIGFRRRRRSAVMRAFDSRVV